jgi:MoxR-like ATPase
MDELGQESGQTTRRALRKRFDDMVARIGDVVVGKTEQVELALTCLFARGHLLIEDLPGIGKTTLAKVLAKSLGLGFRRVQFTSDMLPGDVLGTSVFEQKQGVFVFHPGPIFTQVLLADEINRATPKTQSALLEAMEENQVTVEGKTRPLDDPFFVIATQNPLEHIGTFPLPESQLDRFLMSIELGYPGREGERRLLARGGAAERLAAVGAFLTRGDVLRIQKAAAAVSASDALLEYLQDIIDFTRGGAHFHLGLSPRAGLALLQAARAWALLHGRGYVIPEDLQKVFPWVVGHRLRDRRDLRPVGRVRLMQLLLEIPIP